MADFPASVWAGYGGLVDLVSYFTAARANDISDEVVALETYLITTTRADNTFFAGPASGGPLAPTWRAVDPADLPTATDAAQGAVELATDAEAVTGTATDRAMTPANVTAVIPAAPAASLGVRLNSSGNLFMPDNGQSYYQTLATSRSNYMSAHSSTEAHRWSLNFRKSHQNTVGDTVTVTGEYLGDVLWWGNSGAAFTEAASIVALQNGAAGVYTPADIVFYTSPGGTGLAEACRITKDGHLVMAASHDINLANGRSVGIDSSNERIEFYAAGNIALMGAQVGIGTATVNANQTIGLTIDQGASDDEAVNLRSSDVGAVLSTVETGTYATMHKSIDGDGGYAIDGFKDAASSVALLLRGYMAGDATTTKATSALGIITLIGRQTDGSALTDTVADGNVLTVNTQRSGGLVALMIIDEDADMNLPSGRIATGHGDYWDIEDYHAGAPTADGYVQVDINGTTYQLLANIP